MYDVGAAVTLYVGAAGTLAGITSGTPYEFGWGWPETEVLERAGAARQFAELAWAEHRDGAAWSRSGVHTLTSTVALGTTEAVEFGVGHPVSTDHDTSWWECGHASGLSGEAEPPAGQPRTDALDNPGTMRGFDCIPFTQRAAQGTSVRWGGAGGFEGDQFRVPIAWERGAELVLGASPAIAWASTSATTQQLVLDAEQVGGAGARWQHSAIALLGTNNGRFVVEYAEDSAFTTPSRSTWTATAPRCTSTSWATTFTASSATIQKLWRDGELAAGTRAPAERGSPRYVEIVHNAGDVLELQYTGNQLDNGLIAGTTLVLWGPDQTHLFLDYPQGVLVRSSTAGLTSVYPRFMRVTIDGDATQGQPPDEHWQLGRLQAGLTLPITVPMDWSTQDDDEDPNVDLQTVASGKRTAYRQGPPRRTLEGTSRGDVDRWRIAFRSTVPALAGYSQHPVLLCTDDQQLHLRSLYARLTSSTELANAGWRYNRDSKRWEQVGDLRMIFQQEVNHAWAVPSAPRDRALPRGAVRWPWAAERCVAGPPADRSEHAGRSAVHGSGVRQRSRGATGNARLHHHQLQHGARVQLPGQPAGRARDRHRDDPRRPQQRRAYPAGGDPERAGGRGRHGGPGAPAGWRG